MSKMASRVERLERLEPPAGRGMPFLWCYGSSLADALATAKLTLDDGPLFAIRLVPPSGPECPLYLRDRHLLEPDRFAG